MEGERPRNEAEREGASDGSPPWANAGSTRITRENEPERPFCLPTDARSIFHEGEAPHARVRRGRLDRSPGELDSGPPRAQRICNPCPEGVHALLLRARVTPRGVE